MLGKMDDEALKQRKEYDQVTFDMLPRALHYVVGHTTPTLLSLTDNPNVSWQFSEKVINERDILGTQLIRRNDELALLYEKLKIQQSTLKKVSPRFRTVSSVLGSAVYTID